MPYHWLRALMLMMFCCLAGQPGLAQRSAVSGIAPRRVVAQSVFLGVEVPSEVQSAAARSRTAPAMQPFVPVPEPLYVFNSSVIVGGNSLAGINPRAIQELKIYKGATDAPWRWRNLTAHGIVNFTIPAKIKSKTFAQIGRRLKVNGPTNYLVNGLLVGDISLRIATADIAEIQVTQSISTFSGMVVSIRTVVVKHTPNNDTAGTIMIRGTAAR